MASSTIEATFGVRTLTDAIRTFNTKPYDSFFTRLFQEGRQIKPDGRKAEWDEIQSSRGLAPVTLPTSVAPISPNQTKQNRDSAMIFTQESRLLTWDKLFLDRHMGELRDNAKAVVYDELEDMFLEIGKTVEYSCAGAMTTGGVVVSPAAIPGSDTTYTVTFTPNTYSFSADWATAGTAIIGSEMPKVQANMVAASGMPARRAITNDVTAQYLIENTEAQKFLANQQWAVNVLRASIVNGNEDALRGVNLADVAWKVNAYGYVPAGGAFTRWMPTDRVIFLPDDLTGVLGFAEGKTATPSKAIGPVELGINLGRGMVAYAEETSSPVGIRIYVVRHFLPILLFPKALTFATVH